MLQGIIIAATEAECLIGKVIQGGYLWTVTKDFPRALAELQSEGNQCLAIVETDEMCRCAGSLGIPVIGYINPELPEQELKEAAILVEGFQEIDVMFLENVHTRAMGLPVTIAKTARLLIREMTMQDVDALYEIYEHPEIGNFEQSLGSDRAEQEDKFRAYITHMYGLCQFGMWVIVERASGRVIGRAGFGIADYGEKAEIDLGYIIGVPYQRKGYAREACEAVLEYGKEILEFPEVSAYIHKENAGSIALIKKLGFELTEEIDTGEDILQRYVKRNGK